ncbi:MAG: LptE family protein [Bacteroidota bacterium]
MMRVSAWPALPALVVFALGWAGCGYYSFTGASIPAHLETVAIPLAEDRSGSAQPNLVEDLTEQLITQFVRQTRLQLGEEGTATALLTASIDGYRNEPVSVSGDEQATLNRVTIRVTARYYDQVEDRELMPSRSFSAFGEYDPVEAGLDGEFVAAAEALEALSTDIFTAATSDW